MSQKLSREYIKRLGRRGSEESKGSGGGLSQDAIEAALAGYAKEGWVNENYLSIEFFNRIFTIHGSDNNTNVDVEPNDLETTITSIEAMFGFWTDYYVSALGNGGDLGSTLYLSSLADVALTSPISDGQALVYNATLGKWTNQSITTTTALANLTDVLLTTPSANQVLINDGTKWVNSSLKTVNGYSLIGSGDIPASGGGTGNYLPLAGGTMTGGITMQSGSGGAFNSLGLIFTNNNAHIGASNDALGLYAAGNIVMRPSSSTQTSSTGMIISSGSCYYIGGNFGIGSSAPSYKLHVEGNIYATEAIRLRTQSGAFNNYGIWFLDNKARIGASNGGALGLYAAGNIVMRPSSEIETSNTGMIISSSSCYYEGGNFGIGVSNPLNKLHVDGSIRCEGVYASYRIGVGTTSPSYDIHVIGTIYATGSVTALSDARKKDVMGDAKIGVEQIALAPAVQFLWKGERANEGLQVGTLAQYWQGVLPEVVMNRGGELSMQYGVAALVSAIITARKVVDHERRITELESRLKIEN